MDQPGTERDKILAELQGKLDGNIVTVENIDTNGERLEGISGDQCQCHCIFVPGVDKYENKRCNDTRCSNRQKDP